MNMTKMENLITYNKKLSGELKVQQDTIADLRVQEHLVAEVVMWCTLPLFATSINF